MEWIATIIVGLLSLAGVIVTNNASNARLTWALERAQAVTDTKIDELTREVREHNNFARRVPVLEEQLKTLGHRVSSMEGETKR